MARQSWTRTRSDDFGQPLRNRHPRDIGDPFMRRALDFAYDAAGYLAAFFMVGVLLMVLASVIGRLLNFQLRGSDAYAGYCMAAASFLALAHTLKRGEHIPGTLLLERFGGPL